MDSISKQKKYLSENLIVENLRMYGSNKEDIKEFLQAKSGNILAEYLNNKAWNDDSNNNTNIAEVNNVSTDSKEDIKKYLDGYSQIVKYMASFDELASNMYMITSDNAEGKLPELISELTIVRSDLEKAKNVHNSLAVPPSLTQLHNLCGQSLNKLEELCDILNSLFNGKLSNDDAKGKISEILEQSKALNTQISSAVNSIK